jgi:hypothetical protein
MRGDTDITLPILNPCARRGWVVNSVPRLLYPWERDLVPIIEETDKNICTRYYNCMIQLVRSFKVRDVI